MKTQRLIQIAFLTTAILSSSVLFAQSTSSPDTVCAGANGKIYKVTGLPGSTFSWIVTNGTKVSGGNSDSITINWSSTPGTDILSVVEINFLGCPGDTVNLPVVRLAPPTVVLSGSDSICLNSGTTMNKLTLSFTGLSPWTVGYTEDGTPRTVTTSTNPYTFNSQVYSTSGVKPYVPTQINDRLNCSGTFSGSASVTVMPKPTTSPILHY